MIDTGRLEPRGGCVCSIPARTLEHRTSIYLSNRFPDGALWWPTSGEDVLVELPRLAATGAFGVDGAEVLVADRDRRGWPA
jgi:hypothetical protein